MPNWCFTNIAINTDNEETAKAIYDKLENEWLKAPEGEPVSGFGNEWLGCLAVNSGVIDSYDGINESPIACRGEVEDVTLDGESVYMITSTAWGPMIEPIYRAIEKNFGLDGIEIVYSAEEPGNQLFITNDENVADTYYVEIDGESGEQVLGAFGVVDGECDNYSEGDLIDKLKAAFGIGDGENSSIEELLDTAAEHPGIYIYLWEYVPLCDTF